MRDTKGRFIKGYKHTEEWKQALRLRMIGNTYALGNVLSEETRTQMSRSRHGHPHGFKKGQASPMKGKKHSEAAKEKNRIAHLGKTFSQEFLEKRRQTLPRGDTHWNWNPDRTAILEAHRLRSTHEWKVWRTAVFTRDKFTCKECQVPGLYLEPHHIIPQRLDKTRIFDVSNGITLCRPCHLKTLCNEMAFADRYLSLVS